MGTKALIRVFDEENNFLLGIYQHSDGYLSGLGEKLAEFLEKIKFEGYSFEERVMGKAANGMGCLAAQIVGHLKDDWGHVYIIPSSLVEDDSQGIHAHYCYDIHSNYVKVKHLGKTIFKGSFKDFGDYIRFLEKSGHYEDTAFKAFLKQRVFRPRELDR